MRKIEQKYVWLKSGTKCEVLGCYESKYWLIAVDGSWGPGTIDKEAIHFEEPVKKVTEVESLTKFIEYLYDHDLELSYSYENTSLSKHEIVNYIEMYVEAGKN